MRGAAARTPVCSVLPCGPSGRAFLMLQRRPPALYAAFDRFPTRKGASIHIERFARCLFDEAGGGLLYVMGGSEYPSHQIEDDVEIVRFSEVVPNFLHRTIAFGRRLACVLEEAADSLKICHFRDPWSGVPLLLRPRRRYRTVYEVNALPSIELPYTYPSAAPISLDKIRNLERFCLDRADRVVTPSATTRDLLVSIGTDPAKIRVVPNGADVGPRPPRPVAAPPYYLIYFGALQPWQGVDTLIRAFARLADIPELQLVICASARSRHAERLRQLSARLGVAERTMWQCELPEPELTGFRAHATLSIAPLSECARNVVQGCSPLKILESMASGTPVVASDLPPVREIITDGIDGRLVPPDRPPDLARAIRVLLEHPHVIEDLGRRAEACIRSRFTWGRALASLRGVYGALGDGADERDPDRVVDAPAESRREGWRQSGAPEQ